MSATKETDVTAADENGRTLLHEAVIRQDLQAVTSILSAITLLEPSVDPVATSLDPAATSLDPAATSLDPAATSPAPAATSLDPAATSLDPAPTSARTLYLINRADRHKRSAIFYACINGNADIFFALLRHGADVSSADRFGQTCLHHAAINNHAAIAAAVADRTDRDLLDLRDPFNLTALLHASSRGHAAVVAELIARGADVAAVDRRQRNAVHLAAFHNHIEALRVLLEALRTPARAALAGSGDERGGLVVGGDDTAALMDRGDEKNHTPMMLACKKGLTEIVSLLLGNRADPSLQDNKGRTSLHVVCANSYADVAAVLLGSETRDEFINTRDKDGKTALFYAGRKPGPAAQRILALMRESGAQEV